MDQNISTALLNNGFAFIAGEAFLNGGEAESAFADLAVAFEHCLSDGATRRRSYDRSIALPTAQGEHLNLIYMSSDYWQSSEVNPEAGGAIRRFGSLSSEVRNNKQLLELVRFDYSQLPLKELWRNFGRNALEVGIHLIRMPASASSPGVPMPNRAHRDGEFFTFIHLVNRHGVIGGESLIFRSIRSGKELVRGPLLLTQTLQNPLDTLVVWDRDVFHDITPVTVAPGFSEGVRDVILIDFTPLEPVKLDAEGKPVIDGSNFPFAA